MSDENAIDELVRRGQTIADQLGLRDAARAKLTRWTKEERPHMQFKEIGLNEALKIIGCGDPADILYFLEKDRKYPKLLPFKTQGITAVEIKDHRWFIIE